MTLTLNLGCLRIDLLLTTEHFFKHSSGRLSDVPCQQGRHSLGDASPRRRGAVGAAYSMPVRVLPCMLTMTL